MRKACCRRAASSGGDTPRRRSALTPRGEAAEKAAEVAQRYAEMSAVGAVHNELTANLVATLTMNQGRVMDLFRKWDEDGDGQVSRAEFVRAMAALKIEVTDDEVDAVWRIFDRDGSGSVDFREVQRELHRAKERPEVLARVEEVQREKAAARINAIARRRSAAARQRKEDASSSRRSTYRPVLLTR